MLLRDEIILFEYFTAMSCIRKNYNKKILENLRKLQKKLSYKKKICDYIIKNDFKFLTVKKKVKLIKENILNERNSIRY